MTHELRLHTPEDIPRLVNLYNGSYLFAKKVGDLDWIYPFPEKLLASYIERHELYGLSVRLGEIQSSVRLYESTAYNKDILFIGRLAVSREVKGSQFTERNLLPAIIDEASSRNKQELRLTCLAHNMHLVDFYFDLGFEEICERTGQADTGQAVIVKELSFALNPET